MTRRLTMAQATIQFLKAQFVRRDGKEQAFFGGCVGIFGHGNVAGIGQALQQNPDFPYYLFRNEQGMVHAATGFAKMSNRLRTLVCTSSIGPGATNMITGAALATVNRIPVLLLPGDIFARRNVAPVLQQLESTGSQDVSVNDCFRPVSRYWDRIQRPEQILTALPEAMRVLTSPAETGAVTLALPQDVQTEAYDYPEEFFERRVWTIARSRADSGLLKQAAEWIRSSQRPLIIAGGGVIYGEATGELARFASRTGIPVAETQAGKGALHADHPQLAGAMGATGTSAANLLAADADLVIAIGTRLGDFTTASKTAFQNPAVQICEHQRRRVRCVQARGTAADRRRPGDTGRVGQRTVIVADSAELSARDCPPAECVGRGGREDLRSPAWAAAEPGRSDRCTERDPGADRHYRERGGKFAGRPA